MKNIKVAPYPNFLISEEVLERDVKGNSAPVESNSTETEYTFNPANMMVAEFVNGQTRVMRHGPVVTVGPHKYCAVFPNPVHLFVGTAIDSFNRAESIKETSFPSCAEKTGKMLGDVSYLDADVDETHACYDEYLKMRINSIVMLSTAIEAFINHSIPNDYPNRSKIERYESFEDKLTKHLPKSLNREDFWNDLRELKTIILGLYNLRNQIIHLKTNSEEGFQAYSAVISDMVKYNLEESINGVQTFMNTIFPDFIKLKDETN